MGWVNKQTGTSKKTGYFYEGKEIALTGVPGPTGKRIDHNQNWFPEKKKIEAAALWAVTKNFTDVSKLVGVRTYILKKWSKEPWWDNVIQNVRKEQNEILDAKMTQVLDKAIDLIKDRIEGGEYWLDRKKTQETGEPTYIRLPLRAKDATIAVDTLFDKRQLLRGEATTRSESITEVDKLKKLQENFERLAQSKGINPDGELIENQPTEQSEGEVIDQENIEGIPSEVGEGEEPIEAELVEEAGDETPISNRIFQGQK